MGNGAGETIFFWRDKIQSHTVVEEIGKKFVWFRSRNLFSFLLPFYVPDDMDLKSGCSDGGELIEYK